MNITNEMVMEKLAVYDELRPNTRVSTTATKPGKPTDFGRGRNIMSRMGYSAQGSNVSPIGVDQLANRELNQQSALFPDLAKPVVDTTPKPVDYKIDNRMPKTEQYRSLTEGTLGERVNKSWETSLRANPSGEEPAAVAPPKTPRTGGSSKGARTVKPITPGQVNGTIPGWNPLTGFALPADTNQSVAPKKTDIVSAPEASSGAWNPEFGRAPAEDTRQSIQNVYDEAPRSADIDQNIRAHNAQIKQKALQEKKKQYSTNIGNAYRLNPEDKKKKLQQIAANTPGIYWDDPRIEAIYNERAKLNHGMTTFENQRSPRNAELERFQAENDSFNQDIQPMETFRMPVTKNKLQVR